MARWLFTNFFPRTAKRNRLARTSRQDKPQTSCCEKEKEVFWCEVHVYIMRGYYIAIIELSLKLIRTPTSLPLSLPPSFPLSIPLLSSLSLPSFLSLSLFLSHSLSLSLTHLSSHTHSFALSLAYIAHTHASTYLNLSYKYNIPIL